MIFDSTRILHFPTKDFDTQTAHQWYPQMHADHS